MKSNDNRIENLKLMTNSEHVKLHENLKKINGKRIKQAALKAVIQSG